MLDNIPTTLFVKVCIKYIYVRFTNVDLTQSGSTQFILNFHLSAWIWLLYYPHSTITPFLSSLSTFKLLNRLSF